MSESNQLASLSVGNVGESVAFKMPIPNEQELSQRDEDHYYLLFNVEEATVIAKKIIESIQKVESGAWRKDLQ